MPPKALISLLLIIIFAALSMALLGPIVGEAIGRPILTIFAEGAM